MVGRERSRRCITGCAVVVLLVLGGCGDDGDDLATVVPLTKAFCSDVFFDTAALNMQVHGGISFTWEHPCHLYYRRAKSAKQLWGAPRVHRDRLATALGL